MGYEDFFVLEEIRGCLSHLRTPESEARRRHPAEEDEDAPLLGSNPFLVDIAKINNSKSIRRLSGRTQVMTNPEGAYVRTRLIHTGEVEACATTIADILGLNTELTRAIARAHDIGHVTFGHPGEKFISNRLGRPFDHATYGVVVAQHLERRRRGLNLTNLTLLGILHHSGGSAPLKTNNAIFQEANVVRFADKISFIIADYNDLIVRTGLRPSNFPRLQELALAIGKNQRERMLFLIHNLCMESAEKGYVSFSESAAAQLFEEFKSEMYNVYPLFNIENGQSILQRVYDFLQEKLPTVPPIIALTMMTDQDAITLGTDPLLSMTTLMKTSLWEILPYLEDKGDLNPTDPDLNW